MSQSTIIEVEIGLDKFELFCGSRAPAVDAGVGLNETRHFTDEKTSAQYSERFPIVDSNSAVACGPSLS